MAAKQCIQCGGWFEAEVFFRKNLLPYASSKSGHHPNCIGCEQTARDERKQRNRWIVKIEGAIRRHAKRLSIPVQHLADDFGWQLNRMVHDAQHAYENGCVYCGHRFKEMGHGLSDLTLDIVNPVDPPFYTTNVRWACATCNREKGRTDPRLWGAKRVAWEKWKRLKKYPIQPKLF